MVTVDAVLLDLYDTLVRPDWPKLAAGRDELAVRAGADPAVMREQWRCTHERRMLGQYGGLEGDLAAVLGASGVTPSATLVRELARREYANWAAGVHLYADVRPALGRLRRLGYRLAIVSNASCEAGNVVYALGLDWTVDAVVVSCQVGALKPDPVMLRIALDRLDVRPERALLLDDVPANLSAAARLGLLTVLIARQGLPVAGPDAQHPCITDLSGLWALLHPN